MAESDKSILIKILSLGRKVELGTSEGLPAETLTQILALAHTFESSTDIGLQKISELADALHPGMSVEKFAHFMVPIERMLDRSAKDFDFLISTEDKTTPAEKVPLVGILDHLRSGFNVGSIFRVADGFGLSHLHLVGYTSSPDHPGVAKAALGAESTVPWTRWKSMEECLAHLRAEGYALVALETSPTAVSIFDFKFPERTALVLGNERFGINYSNVEACDHTLSIPLRGTKNSLNVVSAFAVAGYEWSRQWTPR